MMDGKQRRSHMFIVISLLLERLLFRGLAESKSRFSLSLSLYLYSKKRSFKINEKKAYSSSTTTFHLFFLFIITTIAKAAEGEAVEVAAASWPLHY